MLVRRVGVAASSARMSNPMKSFVSRLQSYSPFSSSQSSLTKSSGLSGEEGEDQDQKPVAVSQSKFSKTSLFPVVNESEDGEDCTHDCASCELSYPAKFKVKSGDVWNSVKPYQTHLVVATGKKDWRKKVETERGSLFEALSDANEGRKQKRMMISASNIPVPSNDSVDTTGTSVLLLPSFQVVENVTTETLPSLISSIDTLTLPGTLPSSETTDYKRPTLTLPSDSPLRIKDSPHKYIVLLCSHTSRDARCGASAPLIASELSRHLRPLGLDRDMHDDRPDGCGIYFVNHVGGHKFAANVLVYRRDEGEMIWLGEEKGWMYWSGFGKEGTLEKLKEAGLQVDVQETVDDEEDATFLWILAKKSGS